MFLSLYINIVKNLTISQALLQKPLEIAIFGLKPTKESPQDSILGDFSSVGRLCPC